MDQLRGGLVKARDGAVALRDGLGSQLAGGLAPAAIELGAFCFSIALWVFGIAAFLVLRPQPDQLRGA